MFCRDRDDFFDIVFFNIQRKSRAHVESYIHSLVAKLALLLNKLKQRAWFGDLVKHMNGGFKEQNFLKI